MKPAQSLTGVERPDDDADAVAEPPLEEAGLPRAFRGQAAHKAPPQAGVHTTASHPCVCRDDNLQLIAMSPRHNSVSVCEAAAACAV